MLMQVLDGCLGFKPHSSQLHTRALTAEQSLLPQSLHFCNFRYTHIYERTYKYLEILIHLRQNFKDEESRRGGT